MSGKMMTGGGFIQEFEECEKHGEYKSNTMMPSGAVAWIPVCPNCRIDIQSKVVAKESDLPSKFRTCNFGNYDTEENKAKEIAVEKCKIYVADFNVGKSANILFTGNAGTGKTHLAAAMLKAIKRRGFSALYMQAREYLDEYWGKDFKERGDWIRSMGKIDFMIIDEIGRSSSTKSASDAMFSLIQERYGAESPVLLISNLSPKESKEEIGKAAFERVLENGFGIKFPWDSYRVKIAKERVQKVEKMKKF